MFGLLRFFLWALRGFAWAVVGALIVWTAIEHDLHTRCERAIEWLKIEFHMDRNRR